MSLFWPSSWVLSFAEDPKGQQNRRNSPDHLHGSFRFPSRAFVFISILRLSRKNISFFLRTLQSFCLSPFEGIVFSVRRPCTQEPYRFLDAIALILCWRCVVRTVL
jgi:hypothetical protein